MERGSIKGEKWGWVEFENNEVHRKDVEGDDKNGGRDKGRDKDKIEKHAFHARAGEHAPDTHKKNKKESLPCGDGKVAAEEEEEAWEEEEEYKRGERAHVEEDDRNI